MNKTYQILMTVLIATVAITAQIPNNGLVAWFPFNGNYGDESDNKATITSYGAPKLISDRNGTSNAAYELDGYTQGFKSLNAGKLPVGNQDFTITAWFISKAGGVPRTLVSWGIDSIGLNSEVSFYKATIDGEPYLGLTNGVDSIVSICPTRATEKWFFVAVKVSAGNATFYMNGVPTTPQKINFNVLSSGVLGLGLNMQNDVLRGNYFGGSLDDITIYSRALSDAEITNMKTCKPTRNLAPSITSTAVTKGKATVEYSYTITTSDPESQNVTVTVPVKPSGMSFSGNKLTWTPTAAQVGTHQVSIIAKDNMGDSATQKFSIVVEASTSVTYKVTPIKTNVGTTTEKLYSPNGRLYQKSFSGIALSKNHSRLMIK